jgi:hypothetical protein
VLFVGLLKFQMDQSEGQNTAFGRPERPPNPVPKIAFKVAAAFAAVGLLAIIRSNRLDWIELIVRIATGLWYFGKTSCNREYNLQGYRNRCSHLFVEQNRSTNAASVVSIPVALFESQGLNEMSNPVVHINGGQTIAVLSVRKFGSRNLVSLLVFGTEISFYSTKEESGIPA